MDSYGFPWVRKAVLPSKDKHIIIIITIIIIISATALAAAGVSRALFYFQSIIDSIDEID